MRYDPSNATWEAGGDVKVPFSLASASGAITQKSGLIFVTKAGVAVLTISDPVADVDDGKELTLISETANAHTLTRATTGFNDLGAAGDVATFGGAKGDGLTIVARNGKWWVKNATNVTLG